MNMIDTATNVYNSITPILGVIAAIVSCSIILVINIPLYGHLRNRFRTWCVESIGPRSITILITLLIVYYTLLSIMAPIMAYLELTGNRETVLFSTLTYVIYPIIGVLIVFAILFIGGTFSLPLYMEIKFIIWTISSIREVKSEALPMRLLWYMILIIAHIVMILISIVALSKLILEAQDIPQILIGFFFVSIGMIVYHIVKFRRKKSKG